MESLYFLVPSALIFIVIAIKVLFWAINNGQYDNLDTEAHRILFDDQKQPLDNKPLSNDHHESAEQESNNKQQSTSPENRKIDKIEHND